MPIKFNIIIFYYNQYLKDIIWHENCIIKIEFFLLFFITEMIMITHRQQVTDMIISAKVLKSIKWSDVAKERLCCTNLSIKAFSAI
ncbi:hypothetical protein A3K93_14490 (plasmid) [Acinetobacter sp. NCu2D-2]|nr:hypothetical protein A3K93_14490 [Acinetobacter sp. NCu2D-2]